MLIRMIDSNVRSCVQTFVDNIRNFESSKTFLVHLVGLQVGELKTLFISLFRNIILENKELKIF